MASQNTSISDLSAKTNKPQQKSDEENLKRTKDFSNVNYLFQQIDNVYRPYRTYFTTETKKFFISGILLFLASFTITLYCSYQSGLGLNLKSFKKENEFCNPSQKWLQLITESLNIDKAKASSACIAMSGLTHNGTEPITIALALIAIQATLAIAIAFSESRSKTQTTQTANLSFFISLFVSAFIGATVLDSFGRYGTWGIILQAAILFCSCYLTNIGNALNRDFAEDRKKWEKTLDKWKGIYGKCLHDSNLTEKNHYRYYLRLIRFSFLFCITLTMSPAFIISIVQKNSLINPPTKYLFPFILSWILLTILVLEHILVTYFLNADILIVLDDLDKEACEENQNKPKPSIWLFYLCLLILIFSFALFFIYAFNPSTCQLTASFFSLILFIILILFIFHNKNLEKIRKLFPINKLIKPIRYHNLKMEYNNLRQEYDKLKEEIKSFKEKQLQEASQTKETINQQQLTEMINLLRRQNEEIQILISQNSQRQKKSRRHLFKF